MNILYIPTPSVLWAQTCGLKFFLTKPFSSLVPICSNVSQTQMGWTYITFYCLSFFSSFISPRHLAALCVCVCTFCKFVYKDRLTRSTVTPLFTRKNREHLIFGSSASDLISGKQTSLRMEKLRVLLTDWNLKDFALWYMRHRVSL